MQRWLADVGCHGRAGASNPRFPRDRRWLLNVSGKEPTARLAMQATHRLSWGPVQTSAVRNCDELIKNPERGSPLRIEKPRCGSSFYVTAGAVRRRRDAA